MRLLATADLHGGVTRYGVTTPSGSNSRIDDFAATLERFVDEAMDRKVDLAAFAGDTFNTRREGPVERAMFAAAVRRLVGNGITVIVCPGNHDGMTTVGDADTHALRWLAELRLPRVIVATTFMRQHYIGLGDRHVGLTVLPYPHKRAFDIQLGHLSPEERVLEAGRRLSEAVREVGRHDDVGEMGDFPRLFVGHLTAAGARAGGESTMQMSWDVTLDPSALEGWDFALLGHIHRQQQVAPNAWYAGSPSFLDFGDLGQTKGFLQVDFERGSQPVVEVVDSAPRPMVEVPITLHDDGSDRYDSKLIPPGAIVRAVVKPEGDQRPNMARIAGLLSSMRAGGASYVKLHLVMPERAATQRVAVSATDDVLSATARWLTANDHPLEPTMDVARHLVGTATGGTG